MHENKCVITQTTKDTTQEGEGGECGLKCLFFRVHIYAELTAFSLTNSCGFPYLSANYHFITCCLQSNPEGGTVELSLEEIFTLMSVKKKSRSHFPTVFPTVTFSPLHFRTKTNNFLMNTASLYKRFSFLL